MKATPTTDQYVDAHLRQMRAQLRARTMFGPAGRAVLRSKGERILYAPDGTPIRVVELPEGGNQIEHVGAGGIERLHAHIRPDPIQLRITTS